jgi:hypothetical protein
MLPQIQLSGLIKIGALEHVKMLQKSGLIYLNNLRYYRELETKESNLRKDHREASYSNEILSSLEIFKDGKKIPFQFLSGRFNQYMPENLSHHIYCMYAINSKHLNKGNFINPDLVRFGESALIITDHAEFIERVKAKLNSIKLNWVIDLVKYYDPKVNLEGLTAFHKPIEYEYQNELRILVMGHTEPTLQIEIGSIIDISVLIESKDLLKLSIDVEK